MTAQEFRRLALSMPQAGEKRDMGHPDFRVAGKIFATLGPDGDWAMLKLTLDQQSRLIRADPKVFAPIKGGWGAKGATRLLLAPAKTSGIREALFAAWSNTAPKKLVEEID